jgi:16S rRNA (cytosine1402-N4)-methyltransferase
LTSTEIKESNFFHRPAMADEVLRFLINDRNGVYFDLTVGGGGHLRFISEVLSEQALLIGVDRDPEAVTEAKRNLNRASQKVQLVNRTFDELGRIAEDLAIREIDGILMDLGISSHQIDSPQRGFSFSSSGPLDMRMGGSSSTGLTAEVIVNEYSETNLLLLFRKYGESKYARRVAAAICKARRGGRITTTSRLTEVVESVLPARSTAALAALYQALRIEINRELDQLTEVLPQAVNLLKKNGRMVVISYHSLEDRIVKRFFAREAKGCICPPEIPVCVCEHKPTVRILTKKVIKPSADEIKENRRVRSARLRAVEKVE